MSARPTLATHLAAARARLAAAGIGAAEAAVDVEVYARRILDWDRARLLTSLRDPVPEGLEPGFDAWVTRRAAHEPTAYIVGEREFYGRALEVTPAVLVPRPETEHIVEALAPYLAAQPEAIVADIGTGSGNIGVTLACEAPRCRVVATDISGSALAVAARNARRYGVESRMQFVETAFLDGVDLTFDIIASNPPYVREVDRAGLGRGVLQEPAVALFGGQDGMRAIEAVLDASLAHLRSGGVLAMEFGFGQEAAVREAIARHPSLRVVRVMEDLQGLPRTVVVERE